MKTILIFVVLLLVTQKVLIAITRTVPTEYLTITEAVDYSMDFDTVLVNPGTYYERVYCYRPIVLTSIYIFSNDSTDIYNTIIKLPLNVTNDSTSVIRVQNSSFFNLVGITVSGGRGTGNTPNSSSYRLSGGGLFSENSNIFLKNCIFVKNEANEGGGVMLYYGRGILEDCRFDSCLAYSNNSTSEAGGFYALRCDSIELVRTSFVNCRSNNASAGGADLTPTIFGKVSHCYFVNNYAYFDGGGLRTINTPIIEYNYFENNRAWVGAGLIAANYDSNSSYRIYNNIFLNNTAYRNETTPGEGGGVYLTSQLHEEWTLESNYFNNNFARDGGAIVVQRGTVLIQNNFFINNSSWRYGSICFVRQFATVTVDSNYLYRNRSQAAFYAYSSSSINAFNNDFIQNGYITVSQEPNSPISVANNYWGHPSGPVEWITNSNPNGQGDSVYFSTPYIPFRTTPVFPELQVKDFGDGSERGQNGSGLPNTITIEKVYPNPSNSTLTVHYTIQRPQLISIRLYDTSGREVYTTLPQPQIAGSHTFSLQTDKIASGLYFLKLSSPTSPTETALQKVVLLK